MSKPAFLETFAPPVPEPMGFNVIVQPLRPEKERESGLVLANITINADLQTKTVGKIVAKGALAWKAKTDALDLGSDPVAAGVEVGDLVVFRQHAGQRLKLRSIRDEKFPGDEEQDSWLLIMQDTDILAKLKPGQESAFYDWL